MERTRCRIGKILYPQYTRNKVVTVYILRTIYVSIPGNVAYNRPAVLLGGHQASLPPGLAVDGNLANAHSMCARTADSLSSNTRAWWYVDLGSTHTVTQFTLLNKLYAAIPDNAGKD